MNSQNTVLIVGGSGYLGRFLIDAFLEDSWRVVFTYHSNNLCDSEISKHAQGYYYDAETGKGMKECFDDIANSLKVVVNCSAVSEPAKCETNPDLAKAINVPVPLIDALDTHYTDDTNPPLLIHVSTDQVYDGDKGNYKEDIPLDDLKPANAYGKSKLDAEKMVVRRWPKHVILRSSIIYGPSVPGITRPLFIQFVDNVLSKKQETTFFYDEFRCPIYVGDICNVMKHFAAAATESTSYTPTTEPKVYNMGGSERLSRYDMASIIANVRGHSSEPIISCSAKDVQRGYQSPPDISMDSSKLMTACSEVTFTAFQDGVSHCFP